MKKPVTLENLNEKINSENLVLQYFKGVDEEDIDAILKTLTEDCVFSIETHRIKLVGHEEITSMFKRLWKNHKSVEHKEFNFVKDHMSNQVAVRFQVKNVLLNGQFIFKSNCNFFTLRDGLFSEVRVYMAGENTLNKED
tara:strand:+ start:438 stop:854 length:417 start_codon:yes stop_codon:yes gene_type:complete